MAPVFQTAGSFAEQYGVKALIYGPPGAGKTPLAATAPSPVILAIEPGMLSLRGSNIPTCMAETPAKIDDFFAWVFSSNEAKQFDTIYVDSVSEMSFVYVREELKRNKDGRKAYGIMAEKVYTHVSNLRYMPNKHMCLLAKKTTDDLGCVVPQFEGRDLSSKIPHMCDEILYLDKAIVPGVGEVSALRAKGTHNILARDRTGLLAEFEQPNLTYIFNKLTAKV